jgi:hypothetical protein
MANSILVISCDPVATAPGSDSIMPLIRKQRDVVSLPAIQLILTSNGKMRFE